MTVPLVLRNTAVVTMDPLQPRAGALLVRDGRIACVANEAAVRAAAGGRYEDEDCGGDLLIPAFIDAHIHLLSYAASLAAVDCSPAAAPDIAALCAAIAARARVTPAGAWIRAVGYRESELAERRHPTRWELDAAAPLNPVRLIHASGHGCVLNSAALAQVGVRITSDEPPGVHIGRRLSDGEPDGLLLGMNAAIARAVPAAGYDDLRAQVAEASRRLLAAGVTAVHDLGVRNDAATLALFARLYADGALGVETEVALGIEPFLAGAAPAGWQGIVKIVIEEIGDRREPAEGDLAAMIARVHAAGCRAAVHCIGEEAVRAAVTAFAQTADSASLRPRRHRLEHASVCPPALARQIAALGLVVVTNPIFLAVSGDRYLRELPADELPHLYTIEGLRRAGVVVAAGSDAPVAPPDPLRSLQAAIARRTATGTRLPGLTADWRAALAAHTTAAAFAGRQEQTRGRLRTGAVADLVRLPATALAGGWTGLPPPPRVMQAGIWRQGRNA